ncbi:MAG TPA: Ig-like domain repeat protein, partial [Pyrinomonadaceae bacterium]
MRKSFPRLFTRKSRLLVVCLILIALVSFGVSVSSHSGGEPATSPDQTQQAQRAGVIGSFLNLLMPLPSITATKVDSFPTTGAGGYDVDADGKADVGDKIRYTVTINNGGPDPANNLTLQDTVDLNTTYIPGSLNVSPLAKDDAYDTVGNTLLEVGVAASGNPAVRVTDPTKDSAFDNDTEFLGDTIIFDTITQNPANGTLTFNTNGTFSYQPNANFIGIDTFKYRIKDSGGLTDVATVSINVTASNPTVSATSKVWYVKNNVAGPGTGTSSDPFKTLVLAQTNSAVGDTVYVDHGDNTTTGQNAGFTMKASQRLIGEGVQLDVPLNLNSSGVNPTVLKAAGTKPMLDNIAGDCVTVSNITIAQIRGLNLAGTLNAVDMTTTAANSGGGEIADNIVRSAGQEGLDINGGGTGTLTVSIHDNTITSTGDGINIFRAAVSNVTVTAFDDNVVMGATAGNGINVLGSGGTVLFDANPATPAFDTVAGGNTVIGSAGAGSGVGLTGLSLINIRGDISFNDLDIFTDNGTALSVLGTTPNYTGTSGTRVVASTNTPTLVSINGAAADITDANVNLVPTTMSSTNSTSTGVSLVRVSGTFTAPAGSSITNATSTDFLINGNSNANANVNVTYPGTITDDVGSLVSITNVTAASTHVFSGAITDNNDGDGGELGVSLTGNSGATITFSGGLLIRTTTNPAFTATGGGTVNVCDENPCNAGATGALVNQLTTTTGTALNVASTNIGANGLEFRSISAGTAASGPANGIILNSTGTSNGLSVKGTGSAGTGGTIQKATGDGVSLTTTEKLSLKYMNIQNNLGDGIGGSGVNGLVLDNLSITGNGDNAATDESGINLAEVIGSSSGGARPTSITNSTISNNWEFQAQITNTTGTLTDLTMSGNTISTTVASGIIANLFNFLGHGTSIMKLTVTGGTYTGNWNPASPPANPSGTAIHCDTDSSQSLTCNVSGTNFNNNNAGVNASTGPSNADLTFNISNNNFQTQRTVPVNIFNNGNAPYGRLVQGIIQGNTIGTNGVAASGSTFGNAIAVSNEGTVDTRVLINNNQIHQIGTGPGAGVTAIDVENGIGSGPTGAQTTAITITGNTINNVLNGRGITINQTDYVSASAGNAGTICADISGNNFTGTIAGQAGNGNRMRLDKNGNAGTAVFTVRQGPDVNGLAAANTGVTGAQISIGGPPTYNGPDCTDPVAMLNIQNNSGESFAQNNELQNDSASTLFDFVKSNANAYASISDTVSRATQSGSVNTNGQQGVNESENNSASTGAANVAPGTEIEKGAFVLAHGDSPTIASRLSSFISAITGAVAPTAHAAPAPPPALDINQNFGTLPAGKSLTITFDVSVNGPHPLASYTNQGTVKADSVADKLTDDPSVGGGSDPTVTPGDRYDTTTAVTAIPPSPSNFGDSVAFTAIVTPTEGVGVTPNGTVQFKDGVTNLGAAVNCLPIAGNKCQADLPALTTLTAGSHSITAEYSGGTNHDPSTSPTLTYVVNACVPNPIVTTAADNAGGVNPAQGAGTGTLRQAVIDVCPGTTITFAGGVTGQINLLAALPDLNKNMTITGPGANVLEVRGSQVGLGYRVFNVTSAATNITISGLTISNGSNAAGGGGIMNAGTLTLNDSAVGNASTSNGNTTTGSGGGILNSGTLTINRSAITNNVASLQGGGISNTGTLTITNSTISGNTANVAGVGLGGGIYNNSGVNAVLIHSSTIASNTADASGGGIYNLSGTITFDNTIVGDNTATASPDLSGAGTYVTNDYNLFENPWTGFVAAAHDKTGDPLLFPLANNGGPTYTHALQVGSPAIDAANTALTVDQRNQTRPIDNPNVANVGNGTDIGAYEAPAPPSAPDLDAASDTPPANNTDNITNDTTPTFTIAGVVNGATVALYRDGVFRVSGTAVGASIQLTDPAVTDGTYTYTAVQIVNGGTSPASTGLSVTIDTVAPTLLISAPSQASANSASTVTYTVTYSGADAVTLANGNITLNSTGTANATVGVACVANICTITLNGFTGTGTLGISIAAGTASDTAGNLALAAGPSATFTVDADSPTVSMASAAPNPTNTSPIPVTVTFNEPVFGFISTDIVPGNGTVGNFSGADGSSVYTFDLTPSGQGTVTADISAGVATDAAGNGNTAATQFSRVFDTVAPTVNITAVAPDPRNTSVSSITIVFSEAVVGFDLADLSLTRDGGGNLLTGAQTLTTLDNITWTLGNLSGLTGTQGTYLLTLTAPGGITDAANNALATGATESWVVDTAPPTVSMASVAPNPTNTSPIPVTVTFNEPVFGFISTDIVPGNGTVGNFSGADGSSVYTFDLTPTGQGTVTADIAGGVATDQAGNGNTAATQFSRVFDSIAPTVNIGAPSQAFANGTSSVTYTVTYTDVNFNAATLSTGDITLNTTNTASGTVGVACVTNTCTVTINALTGNGTIGISLAAGTANDTAGNQSAAAGPSATFTVDTTQPSVTINQAAGQSDPGGGASVNFTAVFSEPVTGFDSTDVTFSGAGSTTATVTEIAPNDGTTYRVAISGMNTFGLVTASINAGVAQDAAGNLSTASTSTDNTVNYILDVATAFVVDSLANTDDGTCDPGIGNNDCTLREAINAANLDAGLETITFAPALTSGGPATITLDGLGALANIAGDLTITGPTNNRLTISGNNTSRVFTIDPTFNVAISNLTIANGRDGFGGGIYSEGNLTITNSTLTNNHAVLGLPGATGEGGAIDSEGGLLTIINSTISGNSAETFGGGLNNCGNSTAVLTNVTITGNRADVDNLPPGGGGGIAQVSSIPNSVTLVNTIVAGNFKGSAGSTADDINVDPSSSLDLAGSKNNLIGDAATAGGITNGGANNNKVGNSGAGTISISTVLDTTLASNGGPTQTHLLAPGSPAINAGNDCVTLAGGCLTTPLSTDQRGTGFPRLAGAHVDIGAVEVSFVILPISGAPQSAVIGTAFAVASRVTVTESGIYKTGISVTFTAPNSGPSGTFPGNFTVVTVATDALGIATSPVFTANNIVGGPYGMIATLTGSSQSTPIGELTNTKIPATVNLSNLVQTYDGTQKSAGVTTTPPGLNVVVTYNGSTTVPTNAGNYQVVATINDASYQGSATGTLQVNKATPTITFNPPLAKTFGDPDFIVTASINALTGGPVNLSATGQCTLTNTGTGQETVHLTGAGACNITASRAADTNYNAPPDVVRNITIGKSNQTITFGALAGKTFGNPDFTISATASSGLPVAFAASGPCTVSGTGTGTVHLTGAGTCSITASQGGNGNYNAASDVVQQFNVAQAATTTSLTSSVNPSNVGQNVTFTATVSSGAGTPTGTVQFKDGVTNLGAPVALNASGVATFQTNTLTAGNHPITAVYSGDVNFATSTGTLTGGQQVNIQTTISINDVSLTEGNSGTKNFDFTVTLSQASNLTVTVDFATANGTATIAGNDYQSATGTLTFIPGDLTKTITVLVNGDTSNEANETFFVNLTNAQNTTISDNQGQGTILNDDAPGVQFSTNAYGVNEAVPAGFATITVNRSGDLSTAITVDYQTSDQSGTTPCQTNNTGFASDRCDYATAAGTLSFAAGEASKTIPVVIINDAYVEPLEQFNIKLINPVGATLGSTDTATVTITDNDTQIATANPIDNVDFFIFMQYADFLGRVPDAAGFQFWKTRMTTPCPAGQQCDRIDTALRFFGSDEFKERGYFVYVFYHAALGRRPTYAEWIMDVSKLN